jgi:hypothetical protein
VNGTLQDRLVKALRRAKISDLGSANRFLREKFLPAFNRRFVRKAAKPGDLHRRVPRGLDLDRVLSIRERRVVQNDWTLRFENRWFQLAEKHQKLALAGRSVTVCRRLDGGLELLYGGRELSYRELPAPPQRRQEEVVPEIRSHQGQLLAHLGQLEPTVLKSQGPVILHHACLPDRKHSSQIQLGRHAAMQVARSGRLLHKPPVERRQKLLSQESVRRRQVAELLAPQGLHEPVLKSSMHPFHASLRQRDLPPTHPGKHLQAMSLPPIHRNRLHSGPPSEAPAWGHFYR